MIERLNQLESEFAKKLLFALKCRIIERWQITVATLLAYLENPAFLNTTESLNLAYASRDEIAIKASELYTRLFPAVSPPVPENDSDDPDEPQLVEVEPMPPQRSFSDELNDCVDEPTPAPVLQTAISATPLDDIKEDMSSFERNGQRPLSLQKVATQFEKILDFSLCFAFCRCTIPYCMCLLRAARQKYEGFLILKIKMP